MHEIQSGSDSMTTLELNVRHWASACCLSLAGPTLAQTWKVPPVTSARHSKAVVLFLLICCLLLPLFFVEVCLVLACVVN